MTALLRLEGVVAGYGQAMVLRGVDLDVRAAAVTCLIGPNGAGKSTVLNTISGLLSPREGSITLNGRPIHGLSPRTVLESGVVHLPQERSLFPLMTVWENMLMGAYLVKDRRTAQRRVEQVAELYPLIGRRRHDRAGSLSGGEQRIVELARALLLDPLLVLMDEPSIGLAPQASRQVFDGIVAMRQAGQTVLLVEQNARSGLAVADHGVVLETGVVRHQGTGEQLLADPEVARLYLGAAATSGLSRGPRGRTDAGPGAAS
jgi:branched-chain amino acid transport system ATP-binding protein